MKNTLCPKCNKLFNSKTIKIKNVYQYEGLDVLVFDCPICKEETDNLQCD
jgi:RNase P subunit RPR2